MTREQKLEAALSEIAHLAPGNHLERPERYVARRQIKEFAQRVLEEVDQCDTASSN